MRPWQPSNSSALIAQACRPLDPSRRTNIRNRCVTTETFDTLTAGLYNQAGYSYSSAIGTYTGGTANPFAIMAPGVYGGATDSTHTSPTNYLGVGGDSNSSSPVILKLAKPAAYFGFWWSAGDANNRVSLYSGSTLYGTFTTADLLGFLNNGAGTITATNGTVYQTSAYFGNPNIASGSRDATEPFAYVSFVISGATIDTLWFYNTSATGSSFESDNHSVISSGGTVTIPTIFVPVETLTLATQVQAPTFNPPAGNYTSSQTVTISSTTGGDGGDHQQRDLGGIDQLHNQWIDASRFRWVGIASVGDGECGGDDQGHRIRDRDGE
jgi:hypothetical protein